MSSSSWAGTGESIGTRSRERELDSRQKQVITFTFFSVGSVVAIVVVATVVGILHLAVTVRAARAITIAPVVIAVTAVVLARRVVSATAARRRATAITTGGPTALATVSTVSCIAFAVSSGIESPRSGGWSTSPLFRRQACDHVQS